MHRFALPVQRATLQPMRLRIVLRLAAVASLALPSLARADTSHVVRAGESLTSIAATDRVSERALAAANGLAPDARLIIGTTLRVPGAGAAASRHTAPTHHDYRVKAGDTLSAIADHAGISLDALAALNHIKPAATLLTGTLLKLPGAGAGATATQDTAPTHHDYRVKAGDTLSAIADHAGISLNALAALNHIKPAATLLTGTLLKLPGAGAGATATQDTAPPTTTTASRPATHSPQSPTTPASHSTRSPPSTTSNPPPPSSPAHSSNSQAPAPPPPPARLAPTWSSRATRSRRSPATPASRPASSPPSTTSIRARC